MHRAVSGLSTPRVPVSALLVLLTITTAAFGQSSHPPVYVTLWFDTQDYILPQDDDATKRVAETLTNAGITATLRSSARRRACWNSAGDAT